MSDLPEVSRLDRTSRLRLVALHRLLSLDPIIDALEPDLSSWVLVVSASPEMEELCLITDRLYDLLVEIGELDDARDARALALQVNDAA
ncbi:hypothetical protein [Sagittula stellata]|nr:hypothetical protein [Sagittula stellata]